MIVINDEDFDNFVIFVKNKYSMIKKPFALVIKAKLISDIDLSNPLHIGIAIASQNSAAVGP